VIALVVALLAALILPQPSRTPGAYNPRVTQATIHQTVCIHGYSSRVRPPSSYTSALKIRQLSAFGYVDRNPAHFEEDHFVPLSLGGAPRSPRNLWPEPWVQADRTDEVEFSLYRELCDGRVTLRRARAEIVAWKRTRG
jgi:hypothetical protein